jgi:uncharacterized Fe-S cluster-containing MiaB family protein
MIKLNIKKETFFRLQAFTKEGFKSECKVYEDHAVIEVSKEVLSHLLGKMKEHDSIDAVIVRGISDYIDSCQ